MKLLVIDPENNNLAETHLPPLSVTADTWSNNYIAMHKSNTPCFESGVGLMNPHIFM